MSESDDRFAECPECAEFLDWIAEFLDGEASTEVRQELMLHVHSCASCTRLVWSLRRVLGFCRTQVGQEVPQVVHEQLWQVLIQEFGDVGRDGSDRPRDRT